jgi:hypothetical protein
MMILAREIVGSKEWKFRHNQDDLFVHFDAPSLRILILILAKS